MFIIIQAGDPTPSKEDYRVTDRIYDSADILGIELLDHIVIGDGTFVSILLERNQVAKWIYLVLNLKILVLI